VDTPAADEPVNEGHGGRAPPPETFEEAKDKLSPLERANIAFIKRTFHYRWLDRFFLWCQEALGAFWVHHCTKYIRLDCNLDRVGPLESMEPLILISNHRSFFDMYVINMVLCRNGFQQRLLFPVRSNFFYDNPIGFFVNLIMSWFSMYPPIFRDRKRMMLNYTAFSELSAALKTGRSTGFHPEGRRKTDDDPYTLLNAQAGLGRLIHLSRVRVIPVFINGLSNHLPSQVAGNFNKKGKKIIVNFGKAIDFGPLLDEPANAKTFRKLSEVAMEHIVALGQEEKEIRAKLTAP
jgi:1-acyl-sn-glycerol-3-phosphate acyltransferase